MSTSKKDGSDSDGSDIEDENFRESSTTKKGGSQFDEKGKMVGQKVEIDGTGQESKLGGADDDSIKKYFDRNPSLGVQEPEGNDEDDDDADYDQIRDRKRRRSKDGVNNNDKTWDNNLFNDSGSSGDDSISSFNDSQHNRKNMKTLQSSVRDHELPLRIAYEQLDELAANAEKVKRAIKKNRSILNVQVQKSNIRYLRAAFAAWKLHFDWKKTKKRDIARATTWHKRFSVQRAFKAWIKDHSSSAKFRRLEKSVTIILQRHNMRRCWKAWLALIKVMLRDQDEHKKEKRLVKDLDSKYQEKICRRACNVMYKRRLQRLFRAFKDGCKISELQDKWEEGIETNLNRRKLKRLYQSWKRITRESSKLPELLQVRYNRRVLRHCFKQWLTIEKELAEDPSGDPKEAAFSGWAGIVKDKKGFEEKVERTLSSAKDRVLKNAFVTLVDCCRECQLSVNVANRALKKMQHWRLNKAFQAWICYMQLEAQKKMVKLQEHVVTVEKENDRLGAENVRLAAVIDSGNWGKERVSELMQAGQVLSGERDALTRLLGRMQRHHSFALHQQRQHEEEIRELKRQLMGKKHLMRNKLLVKGASSFNSLIKAMKDDVLKNGSDQELLYTIDKLAMEEVTVFPDGDLHLKAMPAFEKGKGGWSRHTSPNSNPPASQASQQTPAAPFRDSTPVRRTVRTRTPTKPADSDNDMYPASPSPTSKPAMPTTPRLPANPMRPVRSKSPMRGRAIEHFDYDQNTRNTRQEGSLGIHKEQEVLAKGIHRDDGPQQKHISQSAPTLSS